MNTVTKILIALVIIIGLGFIFMKKEETVAPAAPVADSIKGCYLASIAKDRYLLAVTAVNGENIEGSLQYKNFEKDSSHGTLMGTYANGILTGDYSFASEGMDSVAQVVFKKTANGFVRGFGETKTEGNREALVNPAAVSYENSPEFVHTDDCTIPTVS